MHVLEVKYLGRQSIKLNDVTIEFPFAKAEYLFYLIAHEKSITRDKLSAFLWGDMNEDAAKRSLRNAVYTVRKCFYDTVLVSPKRQLLELDEECRLITDVDYIKEYDVNKAFDELSVNKLIDIYSGDFLEGMGSKVSPELEDWAEACRVKYRNLYVEKLKEAISCLMKKNLYDLGEKCCLKLIEIEEFEEIGYRSLMSIYSSMERYNDAINVYNKLEKILRENLSVSPLAETRKMIDNILKKHAGGKTENKKTDFYGRQREVEELRLNLMKFITNKDFLSYIVYGEAGVGKTRFLEEITNDLSYDVLLVKTTCYDVESDFMFKLWDKLFERLSKILEGKSINLPFDITNYVKRLFPTLDIELKNMDYSLKHKDNHFIMEDYICDLFSAICKKRKVIFIIDDIQWADKKSLELLCKVIFSNRYNIMMIASCRSESMEVVEKFYLSLCPLKKISKMELGRFTEAETRGFIHLIKPEFAKHSGAIYCESEGNPLFIREMVNSLSQGMDVKNITDKMATLINTRIVKLSDPARKLLIICSMFYEIFDIKALSKIMGINSIELMELIDELLVKDILKEEEYSREKYGLMFTHQKIREYVYSGVSHSKSAILHENIAEYYETRLRNNAIDRIYYPNLIYHFAMADNKFKLFKYEIKDMQLIFDVSHEIFPKSVEKSTGIFELYTHQELLEEKFEKLKEVYNELEFENDKEMLELQIIYLHLYGRFHKDIGDPAKGVNTIIEMIDLSLKNEYHGYAFEGYLQLIQHAINTFNLSLMKSSIENAEKIACVNGETDKCGLVLRFKGYYHILKSDYPTGEDCLIQARDVFNSLNEKENYQLNVAASYFYLGESRRLQEKYVDAVDFYVKAFDLCNEDEDFPAIALILSKIGCAKYALGQYDEAQFYLLKSLKAYNKTIFAWGRAEVYYYLASIYCKKGMNEKATDYCEGVFLYCDKYYNDNLREKAYELLNIIK